MDVLFDFLKREIPSRHQHSRPADISSDIFHGNLLSEVANVDGKNKHKYELRMPNILGQTNQNTSAHTASTTQQATQQQLNFFYEKLLPIEHRLKNQNTKLIREYYYQRELKLMKNKQEYLSRLNEQLEAAPNSQQQKQILEKEMQAFISQGIKRDQRMKQNIQMVMDQCCNAQVTSLSDIPVLHQFAQEVTEDSHEDVPFARRHTQLVSFHKHVYGLLLEKTKYQVEPFGLEYRFHHPFATSSDFFAS